MSHKKSLSIILTNHFYRLTMIPIIVIEITLLVMYFSINYYITEKNSSQLTSDVTSHTINLLALEASKIEQKLSEIARISTVLQQQHQHLFENQDSSSITNSLNLPKFAVAANGVYYKATKNGASLYYSSKTPINEEQKYKAMLTEAMDPLLESIVETNPDIASAYFNSYDDMNRLYPFIDKVYEQYGEHIHMADYNFYYLADLSHNPNKKAVWTQSYLDPAGNGWMASCIVPIYNNNKLEGVSGIDVTIDTFVKKLLNIKLPYEGKMFLLDKEGGIIAMPDSIAKILGLNELKKHVYTDVITQTITKPEEFNITKNESPFASHFKNMFKNNTITNEILINDKTYMAIQHTVELTDWRLMVMLDKQKVFKSVVKLEELSNTIGFLAIFFMSVFYLIFFYYLSKKIDGVAGDVTIPLATLKEQTSKVGYDSLKSTIVDTHIEEIDQLSQDFHHMVQELNVRTLKLVESEVEKKEKEKEALLYLDKSMRDPLTGLYNRNKIDKVVPHFMADFKNKNQPFSVIYVDIDHFKVVNDTFGHASGDEVLKHFSGLLKSIIRKNDIVGRIGGEEFIIIIQSDIEITNKIAEKLRTTIENYNFPINKSVTSSFGITEINQHDTQESIIKRADEALYKAKTSGRNRVYTL